MAAAGKTGREYGKSHPIDALAAGRAALQEPDLPVAHLDGAAREVRLLIDSREDLVAERTRIINRLRAPPRARPDLGPSSPVFRPVEDHQPAQPEPGRPHRDRRPPRRARLGRGCEELTAEINALEAELGALIGTLAPTLLLIMDAGP
jgi:transposase